MWSLLGLAACFADRPDEADRLLDRARAVIPADDGYTRCLVAATAAMADQLADRPATVRAAVEPVWALAMDLGSEFWFAWAQALLGWAVAAEDAPAGLAMMTETVDALRRAPDQAVLPVPARVAAVRGRALARGHGPPRRGPGPPHRDRRAAVGAAAAPHPGPLAGGRRRRRARRARRPTRRGSSPPRRARTSSSAGTTSGGATMSGTGGRRRGPTPTSTRGARSATSRPTRRSPPTSPPSDQPRPAR